MAGRLLIKLYLSYTLRSVMQQAEYMHASFYFGSIYLSKCHSNTMMSCKRKLKLVLSLLNMAEQNIGK